MRIAALLLPALAAIGLLTACGGGCSHGNHRHPTGSTYEEPPNYNTTCTCQENGQLDCGSSGGEAS